MPESIEYVHYFDETIDPSTLPRVFSNPFEINTHSICLRAAEKVQAHLSNQSVWVHNFGLSETHQETPIIGKMFGVLVVKNSCNEIGFLAAFSGKLANANHHAYFVPPVFDLLSEGGFLNLGMQELTRINTEIEVLEKDPSGTHDEKIAQRKKERKEHSNALQHEIFNHYHFLNQAGEEKSLIDIFSSTNQRNPPSGAG